MKAHRPSTFRRRSTIKRRVAYSLAAGAAVVTGGGQEVEAIVFYTDYEPDISIAQEGSQPLDLDGDGNTDITLTNYIFNNGNYQGAFIPFAPGALVGFNANSWNYASALSLGALVDETTVGPFVGSLAYGVENPEAEFNDSTNAFIGLGFPINGSEVNHFGWVRVSINNAAGSFVIHDWAYESEPGVGLVIAEFSPGGLEGDYNGNSIIDAADYTVWRDTLTAGGTELLNDPTPGVVDETDFTYWRDNFGTALGGGAGSAASTAVTATIPEPATLGLLAAGSLGVLVLRRLRGRDS